jgi:hypothetical protein
MIDVVVGAVVMVVASTALVLAIEVGEQAYRSAGRYPLNAAELELVKRAGFEAAAIADLHSDLAGLPEK